MEKTMSERPSASGVSLAACLVLACVTLACSVSLPEWVAEPAPPGPSPATTSDSSGGDTVRDVEEEGGDTAIADAILTLANHSSVAICQVFISSVTDDSWNDDWLGGQPIEPGDTHTFLVASGRYDLQATDCSGGELDIVWDTFISGSRTWQITDADVAGGGLGGGGVAGADATLTLVNDSGRTICYVYISPVTDEYWNDNWLGPRETIAPGESCAFPVLSGDYDLRADDCDHHQIDVVWGMSVTDSQTWTVP
jgi:hypothetical protein